MCLFFFSFQLNITQTRSRILREAANYRKCSGSQLAADLMANADDGSVTRVEVDNLNRMFLYPCKRRARKRRRRYLPPEMVFKILSYLPVHVIHDAKTRICEEWKLMINTKEFIDYHSALGIMIMEEQKPAKGIYVEIRRGRLEICKFDCRDFYLQPSSANGLVLASPANERNHGILYLINPLTKQRESLPYDARLLENTILAFAEASMKHKVVRSVRPKSPPYISVLTVGVDDVWRYLDMQNISTLAREALSRHPFATRGYVHWIGRYSIVTLNVETEIFYEFARPGFHRFEFLTLAMGRNLSSCHLSKLPGSREYLMEVMEMNPETGEWTKLLSSDLKPLSDRFKGLNSVNLFGVLADGEVFLFGISGSEKLCAAYNVRTREIQSFQLEKNAGKCYSVAHVNTMTWYQ